MRKKCRTDWVRNDSNIAQKTIEEQEPSEEDIAEGIDMNKKRRKEVHFKNDEDP